jgi:hypothetical protein
MQPADSDTVIHWAASAFNQAVFMTYEQINAFDCFGRVMRSTLKRRSSPLLGVSAHPTIDSQPKRYMRLGFQKSTAITMLDFWEKVVSPEEVRRITLLEEFDELEEWVVKCSHYFVAVSSIDRSGGDFAAPIHAFEARGLPSSITVTEESLESSKSPPSIVSDSGVATVPFVKLRSDGQSFSGRTSAVRRWAHASVALTEQNKIIIIGGFGGDAKQARLNDVFVLDTATNTWTLPQTSGAAPEKLMFHSAALFGKNQVLVFGGRAAPSAPFSDAYLLDTTTMSWRKPTLLPTSDGALPQARWRHTSTTLRNSQGNEVIVIFGGRGVAGKHDYVPLGDVWCIDPVSLKTWALQIEGNLKPPARFSHAAVAIEKDSKLMIYGGSDGHNRMDDTWILDLESRSWQKVAGAAPPARFAHSLSSFTHHSGNSEYVVLSGGCTPLALNDFHVFDVTSRKWTRIRSSAASFVMPIPFFRSLNILLRAEMNIDAPEKWARNQILLAKHTAHIIPGHAGLPKIFVISGGCLCFSFGTHFNEAYSFDVLLPGDLAPAPGGSESITIPQPAELSSNSVRKTLKKKAAPVTQKGTRSPVKEMSNVTEQMWLDEIYAGRVPVVMKNMDLGSCVQRWKSPEYFLQHVRRNLMLPSPRFLFSDFFMAREGFYQEGLHPD